MTDTKPSPVQLVNCFQIFNALTTHIHGGKLTTAFWTIPGMSQHKIPYSKFQQAYKNSVKVFLDVLRILPRKMTIFFDDVVQISDDGNLSTRPMKISPHFDPNTILLYTKANEDVSKFQSTIKSKEQCEQLRALLALDIRYLNGCDYRWEKPDGTAVPSAANVPALGLITSGEGLGDDLSGDDEAAPSSSSGDRLRVAKDPHDFLGFWDPGNLDAILWSDLSYNDDSNFTAKWSYHAAAILVFYVDALREKHPDFAIGFMLPMMRDGRRISSGR